MDSDPNKQGSHAPVALEYESHLQRSRRVWNWWSSHYTLSESDFAPMRSTTLDHLALSPGDEVIEIGCGPGVNFERIVRDIGPTGRLIAVDVSPRMLEQAKQRIEKHQWQNIELIHADANRLPVTTQFDAAVSTLSLSLMPEIRETIAEIYSCVKAGGSLAVFDLRPIPAGPLRVFNPILRPVLHWIANWNRRETVLDGLSMVFDDVDVVESYLGGTTFTAIARKRQQVDIIED